MRLSPGSLAPSGVGEREGASSGGLSSGGLSSGVGEREGASSGGVSPPGVSPLGWASGREPPPGFSPLLLRGPARLPRLCCDLPALPPGGPFPALRCSPPTLSLSWILLAATGQAGDSGITRPSLQPVSCPRPALLLESWVNRVPGVHD